MRRTLLILLAGMIVGSGCNRNDNSGPASPSQSAEINVGEYGSMTGAQATFGISTDDGIKLAVKQLNDAGGIDGRKINLINYDDQGKQQEAITAVTRLIQEDHVVAVLGEVASSLSIAGGQVCQQNGVPMISPSSTNPKVTEIGNMISRVCFIDPFQGYVGAAFAKNDLHFTKAAILYNRAQAYSAGLRTDFRKAFEKMGGTVLTEQAYADGDTDFSAQLNAIKNTNPDFIYVPGYYTNVVTIAQQARQLGIKCPMIGGDGWVSDQLKNAGHALDDCYFSDHYSQEDKRPEVQKFVADYKAAYGQGPDSMAALGYDAANLLFDAIKRAKSLSGEDLAAAINSTKGFHGVTGTITIDSHRNARKLAVIQRVEDGEFSYFTTIQPPKDQMIGAAVQ
ncbi:MAG TPA: ABC transporter substrate-binding protein [Tepidisphaeraceae bacterium]|nr:ABC transporter substrate-binding protein [Tepidisphaeraceae bacterium]